MVSDGRKNDGNHRESDPSLLYAEQPNYAEKQREAAKMNVLDEVAAEAARMAEAQTQPERRDAEVDMEIDSSTKVAGHCAKRQAVTACLLHLFTISHFSSSSCAKNSSLISCTTTMAKRMQEQKRTRKKCGKIEIYSDEPVLSCSDKVSSAKKSDCTQRSGDTHSYGET